MARSNGSKARKLAELSPCYVPCQVEPGMFRGEYLIYLDACATDDPNKSGRAQLLVDEREVSGLSGTPRRNNPASGWLRVTLLAPRGEWVEVVLPQPSQPFGDQVLVAGRSIKEKVGA
jgi:hypothetical protein